MIASDRPDRPWYFEPTNPFIPEHGGEIRDERGKCVAFADNAETAERIVRAVNGFTGWLPIEGAREDGSRMNLCWKAAGGFSAHVELGKFIAGKGWCNTYGHPFSGTPDYFQHLPKPPVAP